jgi:hypothetical protein
MKRLACWIAVVLATAVLTVPAHAAGVLPVVTILDGTGVKPKVALAAGVAAVAYTDVASPRAVHVSVRRSGGWTDTTVSDAAVDSSKPDVAVSGSGQVDVAWADGTHVVARRQTSAGAWEARAPVTTDNTNTPLSVAIAGNPRGDVAIAWVEFFSGVDVAYASVRRVGEPGWSAPEVLSSTATGDNALTAKVGVDDAGGVTVVWQRETAGDGNWILEGKRLPAGSATWDASSTPLPGSAAVSSPSVSVDRDGNAVVAWLDGSTGYARASYWPAGGAPSSSDLLEKVSELKTAFVSPGHPVVAVIDQYLTPWQLRVHTWSPLTGHFVAPSSPTATGDSLTQLGLAADQNGNVLATVQDTHYEYVRPLDATPTLQPVGGDVLTTTPPNGDLAMDRNGDALIGWSGYRPGSGTQQILAAPYDGSPPATGLDALPTWTLAPTVPLHWTVGDTWSTTASSTLRRASSPGGPWADVVTTAGSSASQSLARGATACFAVRATDPAANTGAWSATQCTAAPVDDRSMSGRKNWRKLTGAAFYAGTALKTKVKGRVLKLGVTGRQLALVASRCGTCGSVKVLVNGALVRKVSLKGAAADRVVFPIVSYPSARTLKVKIVTKSSKKVVIDGLGASQS